MSPIYTLVKLKRLPLIKIFLKKNEKEKKGKKLIGLCPRVC
jgi:hypothetical protein